MQRRHLLQLAGWTWLSGATAVARAAAPTQNKLVVVMLRGAVDGLSIVAPYGDPHYAQSRDTIRLAAPGGGDASLLQLDGLFGLNPALSPLLPYWQRGQLGFVHASGSPDPTRSHFDAQDYMESGTPGLKSTGDGWLNRLLQALPGPAAPTRAVNMGATLPRIFSGTAEVASLGLGPKAFAHEAIDDPRMQAALASMYAKDSQLGHTFDAATEGRGEMQRSMAADAATGGDDKTGMDPRIDRGAPSASGFAADAQRLGRLIQRDPHTQLAFTSVGGWDTHINQGGAKGQLAGKLAALGRGLDALAQGLGPALDNTVVVVMSEFGRTVRENGTHGTDHGRGNVMWLLGGPVNGGHVHGEWPGLDTAALADGRDLAVVSDFRSVLANIAQRHLGLGDAQLAQVFPAEHERWSAWRGAALLRTA
ncbi:MAG: DUF1501 domain-containing protein [Pelomonas sp.]|nr:DUF1501 domain-containing protein [Roseateles sp.]